MSNAAGNQADIANNAASTDASNAASAFGKAQGGIDSYLSNVNSALAAGNPFEAKDYLTQQNLATSGAMNSQNTAAQQQEQSNVARTGTNSAAVANDIANNARTGQRDLTNYNANRDTQNENTWLNQQQQLFGDQARGNSEEAGLYGTALGGQNSTLGTAQTGEDQQGQEYNSMISAGIGAAGVVGGAFCPAKGSLYLTEGGLERPVEALKVGDQLEGIDGEMQQIEEIQVGVFPVLRVTFDNGMVARNSKTHAFALPFGGFTVAIHSLDKAVKTRSGPARVVSVEPDGEDTVFNIITNGSHTYRADGIWALGVGEAERQVTMDQWAKIGEQLRAQ